MSTTLINYYGEPYISLNDEEYLQRTFRKPIEKIFNDMGFVYETMGNGYFKITNHNLCRTYKLHKNEIYAGLYDYVDFAPDDESQRIASNLLYCLGWI